MNFVVMHACCLCSVKQCWYRLAPRHLHRYHIGATDVDIATKCMFSTYQNKYQGLYIINRTGSFVNPDYGTPNQFKYHFFCTGKESEITDCSLSDREVNDSLCDGSFVANLVCDTGDDELYIVCAIIMYVYITCRVSLISNTAHTQSCQQWFSRGKLDSVCLCPHTTVQNQ